MNMQKMYDEWRRVSEAMLRDDFGGSVDCGEASVREDFSNYAELANEISFEDMLELENNYCEEESV